MSAITHIRRQLDEAVPHTRTCQLHGTPFDITAEDIAACKALGVPLPTFSPEARSARRLLWRNERTLYNRTCDFSGKSIISMFPPDSPYKVYARDVWYSDHWDPISYGIDYDFSMPFFSQFQKLLLAVPRVALIQQDPMVNSDYVNRSGKCTNCYLVFGSNFAEDCMYGQFVDSKDSIDCLGLSASELCYECIDCTQCYNVRYAQDSTGCRDSAFLYNCVQCSDCFACINLRNKQFCINNKQYTKEEYQSFMQQYNLRSHSGVKAMAEAFEKMKRESVHPHLSGNGNENVTGNWIYSSSNVHNGFSIRDTEDSRNVFMLHSGARNAYDHSFWGANSEYTYECINVGNDVSRILFATECFNNISNLTYCANCHGSKDLFGCVGLRNKQYCIFNKQYSKDEYEALVDRIITHMLEMPYTDTAGRTYGYGEFFPFELCPFGYNETLAHEYHTLSREQCAALALPWMEPEEKHPAMVLQANEIPDMATEDAATLASKSIGCAGNTSNAYGLGNLAYQILPKEMAFYLRMGIPIPHEAPNRRHYARLQMRTPLRLWTRTCMNPSRHDTQQACSEQFSSAYSPDRPETIYCEVCYQHTVL